MPTLAEQFADYAVGLRFDDLPPEVVTYTKHVILDTVGCMLGGYASAPGEIARALVGTLGGRAEATVAVSGERTTAAQAALANGIMTRYLDFNDIAPGGHCSEIIPAILAVGERQAASGREIVAGVVLGYEVQGRWSRVVPTLHRSLSFTAAIAAPAVAGRLLGLDAGQIANAIGIAASSNAVLPNWLQGQLSMMKTLAYASAAHHGILAALLAERGFTGPTYILEYIGNSLSATGKPVEVGELARGRGPGRYMVSESILKAYASQIFTQAPIAALLHIVAEHHLKAAEIAEIEVCGPERVLRGAHTSPEAYRPTTKEMADHSLPFTLAVAALDGAVGPAQYEGDRWHEPEVRRLMDGVRFTFDERMAKEFLEETDRPSQVLVHTRDGRTFAHLVAHHRGHYRNPMSVDELVAKYRGMASTVLAPAQVDRSVDLLLRLEQVPDIREVMAALVA
jgi:2-methylcitrate dehydratase